MRDILVSLSYKSIILVTVVAVLLGSVLIITKIREKFTKLSWFIYISLWLAVIILSNYILINKCTLLTCILLGIVLIAYALLQNIIDKKKALQEDKIN